MNAPKVLEKVIFPLALNPIATDIMFCSEMKHSTNCSGCDSAKTIVLVEVLMSQSKTKRSLCPLDPIFLKALPTPTLVATSWLLR